VTEQGRLKRSVGFYGLMFVSLGSIIGSGWLLGALNAAEEAGPASILSWLLAAAMLSLLALTYAELGATYPVAGGPGRVPYYAHGPLSGFVAGWTGWLQAVFIAPVEVLAAINYVNSVDYVHEHFNMMQDGLLNGTGVVVAIILMIAFTAINLAGAKFLSESNVLIVVWKTIVPFLAAFVVMGMRFDGNNFHAGGGFMPKGFHGVFAALTGGVVFALQGFEQCAQLAGEARDPRKDLARAIVWAMAIGAVLYALLQFVMIGAIDPANIKNGWLKPLGTSVSAYGAWYTLALAVGAGWLAKMLLVDAVISPAGTGIVYVGTTARLSYALGEERELPRALTKTNKAGVPVVGILVAAVVGCVAFGPFKSWKALVEVVTAATAIMYAFGPLSLAALHKLDPNRPRTYRAPAPKILLPAAFCAANLIIYWGGFATTWKLAIAIVVGLAIFFIGAANAGTLGDMKARNGLWMLPWLGGHVVIGALGRYGGGYNVLPAWVDICAVIAFSLAIFYAALRITLTTQQCAAAIAKDSYQLDFEAPSHDA
jgi:amino acid transporter